MRGKLVVIDGIDGAGKATQAKLLIERLEKAGSKTATLDFPRYYDNFFGKLTGRFLNSEFGNAPKTSPYLASVLYAADRWESKEKIEGWLNEGRIVVLDRYVSSNQIHQAGKIADEKSKKEFLRWLEEMEYDVFKIPRPDFVIFLNVPYEVARKLAAKKKARQYVKGSRKDKVEKSKAYQKASYEQSLALVRECSNWKEIQCVANGKILPPDAISDEIWKVVGDFAAAPEFSDSLLLCAGEEGLN